MPHRLGIIPHAYARPLFAGLEHPEGPASSAFELVKENSAQLAIELRQGNLDGAFLSPVDFARDHSRYVLVPESGVASRGESGTVLLLFRERGTQVRTIAVDPSSTSEIVLAHLVLAEKYDIAPQFVPVQAPPSSALETADAVLVVGDAAAAMAGWERKLDVVDEWEDATGLPFIHGLWAVRPDALDAAHLSRLRRSGPGADARGGTASSGEVWYGLTEDDRGAFGEFLRAAYYHGILKDIPDVFYLPDTSAESNTSTS